MSNTQGQKRGNNKSESTNEFQQKFNYKKVYAESIKNPQKFWENIAVELFWFKKWNEVNSGKFINSKWFSGGKTNICYNCLDRNIPLNKNKAAIIWEGENGDSKVYTYQMLLNEVTLFADSLKSLGIKKNDKIIFYMHNIPELIIGMLACARIGAVHIVLYNGLSPEAIKNRVIESEAKIIVTSDFTFKRGNRIPLKSNIDSIISECETVEKVIIKKRLEEINCNLNPEKDILWEDLIRKSESDCKAAELNSEQPLFYNYTSGLNGEPVGILHTTGGYMVQTYISTKWIFNLKEDDIFWCTADLSWIAGHSYIVYGPLLNGSTVFFYEGTPNYPNEERYWQLIDKYKITIFYSTPTTIRAFRNWGNDLIKKYNLSSLKLLGTVGEPIQPDTWEWFNKNVGRGKCPVINTWLQTETGTILITPFPGDGTPKSESCGLPFPGIEPEILNYKSEKIDKESTGYLVFKNSWPSIMRDVLNKDKQINDFYLKKFKNSFFSGDGAKINKDGTIYILGRVDSTLNVTWQRLSSKEIEDILKTHPDVIETAVVARPDDIKGNSIAAFVVLQKGREELMLLKEELRSFVENKIGTYAKPDEITFLDSLPKDENGKILRRVLRSLAITGKLVEDKSLSEEFTALEKLREDF